MRLPASLVFFLLTGIGFLLQAIPAIGISLMMLAAPFWSVLLVNLGFLGIALEVVRGQIAKGWLLLPILCFGSYGLYAAYEKLALTAIRSEIAEANASVRVPFDPRSDTLLISRPLSTDGVGFPALLVRTFQIPVVFAREQGGTFAYRLAREGTCRRVRTNLRNVANAQAISFYEGDALVRDVCVLRVRQALPAGDRVEIEINQLRPTSERGLRVTRLTIDLHASGRVQRLHGGYTEVLDWIPKPILGCMLGASEWQCTADFMRPMYIPLTAGQSRYEAPTASVAAALGLSPLAPADRPAAADAALVQSYRPWPPVGD